MAWYWRRERIGSGASGDVHRAIALRTWREVAIKRLSTEQSGDELLALRLHNEASKLATLDHPNVVQLYEVERDRNGRIELVLEYVEGTTLAALLQGGPMPLGAGMYVVQGLLRALAHGHENGFVHRDVSPRNILISVEGEVKLADFGLAKSIGMAPTRGNHVGGTLPYMSPEQLQGDKLDERADLFTVGVVMYKLITGNVPFSGTNEHELMAQLLFMKPPSADLVPGRLVPMLSRLLASKLEDRYQSADEALADQPADLIDRDELVALLRARGARARSGKRPPLWVAAALVIATGLGLGATYLHDAGSSAASENRPPGPKPVDRPIVNPSTNDARLSPNSRKPLGEFIWDTD